MPAYLLRQRWYPAKDAGLPRVSIERILPLSMDGLQAALVIWQASSGRQEPLRMCLPLARVSEALVSDASAAAAADIVCRVPNSTDVLIDATALDAVVRALAASIIAPTAHQPGATSQPPGAASQPSADDETRAGPLSFRHTEAATVVDGVTSSAEWVIRRSRAEQSNTSIRVGGGVIFKLIRKLESGTHPELEMGRYLTEKAHFAASPTLLGWIDAGDTTLAILQAFVANDGDGWTWLLERLRSDPNTAGLEWLHTLGERTGELHVALGADTADPAFAPEDIVAADWHEWKQGVLTMAQRAARALEESLDALDDPARRAAGVWTTQMAQLDVLLDGLLPGSGILKKTRHHGDFHLGQVLVQRHDAVIVDFEGEPMRPLAERRAKHCALRDVAGLLRSLGYAAAVAGLSGDAWLDAATDRFLAGYFERAGSSRGCPRDHDAALRLVRFFTIEKALYEVLYELANRPAWAGIPLNAINRLLAA